MALTDKQKEFIQNVVATEYKGGSVYYHKSGRFVTTPGWYWEHGDGVPNTIAGPFSTESDAVEAGRIARFKLVKTNFK